MLDIRFLTKIKLIPKVKLRATAQDGFPVWSVASAGRRVEPLQNECGHTQDQRDANGRLRVYEMQTHVRRLRRQFITLIQKTSMSAVYTLPSSGPLADLAK